MAGDGGGCKGQRDLSTPGSCIPKWLSRCHQSKEGSWQGGSKAEHGDLDRRKGREMWRLQVQERTKAAEKERAGGGNYGEDLKPPDELRRLCPCLSPMGRFSMGSNAGTALPPEN